MQYLNTISDCSRRQFIKRLSSSTVLVAITSCMIGNHLSVRATTKQANVKQQTPVAAVVTRAPLIL